MMYEMIKVARNGIRTRHKRFNYQYRFVTVIPLPCGIP